MKHLTRDRVLARRLLERARTVAVVGASPRPGRHSGQVAGYLRQAGYDVVPVRPDRAEVAGLPAYASLSDVPQSVDLVVIFRRADRVAAHVVEAAARHAEAVWLPPGTWSPEADAAARGAGLALVRDRCVEEEHRHASKGSGLPPRTGAPVGTRRRRLFEDDRKHPGTSGWRPGGGGGGIGGGGVRAVLDERKMTGGRPSPRSGPLKPRT